MQHKKYIDGLRGIAVLSVVFFHANYNFFKGGYLGVDIYVTYNCNLSSVSFLLC